MSPEYNFHLKINAKGDAEALNLRNFMLRIRGVESLEPIDQFRIKTEAGEASLNIVDLNIPVGQVIKRWREARMMRPIDVVREVGSPLSKSYYSQLENGQIKKPSDSHLERIASALRISKDDILLRRMPLEKV